MTYRTISEVSKELCISARMLRYYEQMGLIRSAHRKDYAYRVYDEDTIQRIQHIILLRKLQIPLKKIDAILGESQTNAAALLQEHLQAVQQNIALLQLTEKALHSLIEQSGSGWSENISDTLTKLLPLKKHELGTSCSRTPSEQAQRIRIIMLPPLYVACYEETGESPEEHVGAVMDQFICSEKLYEKKPDARLFGVSPSCEDNNSSIHTYANWVSIPEDTTVPSFFSKHRFAGGLYAAYTIDFPDFHEWEFLKTWARQHPKYQLDHDRLCLEEHLNWVYASYMGWLSDGIDGKVDLLLPIQSR